MSYLVWVMSQFFYLWTEVFLWTRYRQTLLLCLPLTAGYEWVAGVGPSETHW
jgi:hypothetical protein